jgi:glutathione S-transferase
MLEKLTRWVKNDGPEGPPKPTPGLVLYHFTTCPYCVRVRRAVKRLGLDLPMKNIHADREAQQELVQGGGSQQVPCLRIESAQGSTQWLYESQDIVRYLEQHFA